MVVDFLYFLRWSQADMFYNKAFLLEAKCK